MLFGRKAGDPVELFVARLCACGYSDADARSICCEIFRELGTDWLEEYVADVEGSRGVARV